MLKPLQIYWFGYVLIAAGLSVLAIPWSHCQGPPEDEGERALAEMRRIFSGHGSRAPGLAGNLAVEAYVNERFADSGLANGAITFTAPVFVPGPTSITLPGSAPISIQPMHPTLMRPGNFERSEFNSTLVYLGKGEYQDLERLRGTPLDGALALMDFDCGDRWLTFLRLGIRGFVFIGDTAYHYIDSYGKIYNSEVAVPRFFVDAAAGKHLKNAASVKGALEVRINAVASRWRTAMLHDYWVLVPGSDPQLSSDVVVLTAAMDANSVVPQRAIGAQSAGNLYLLLKLLHDFKRQPPARTTMLVAVNGHTQKFLGERMLAWYLLAPVGVVEGLRDQIALGWHKAELYAGHYSQLKLGPFDPAEPYLQVMMEVLWVLDRRQQAARWSDREKRLETGARRLKGLAKQGPDTAELESQVISAIDPILDLTSFSEADYGQAIDEVAGKLDDQKGGWLSWSTPDEEAVRLLNAERERLNDLKWLAFTDLTALAAKVKPVFDDEKLLESWRRKLDSSTGVRLAIKEQLQSEAMRSLNRLKLDILATAQNKDLDPDNRESRLREMRAHKADLTRVLVLFNKIDFGIGRSRTRYRHIAANNAQREILRGYRDKLVTKYSRWSRMLERLVETDSANDAVREGIGPRRVAMVIQLDMNWTSEKIGFCSLAPGVTNDWQRIFGKISSRIADDVDAQRGFHPFIDTMTAVGGRPEEHYFHSRTSAVPHFHVANGTPAVALKNVYENNQRVFSPDDTFVHIDGDRVVRLHAWVRCYLRSFLDHRRITERGNLPRVELTQVDFWSPLVRTLKMDAFEAKTVPSQEVPGSLVAAHAEDSTMDFLVAGDVVNCYSAITDETGHAVLYGLRDTSVIPNAYQLDESFTTVRHTRDIGAILHTTQQQGTIGNGQSMVTLPMFPCREFPIYDRVDPTRVGQQPILVQELWPYTGSEKAEPVKYGTHGVSSLSLAKSNPSRGPAAVYLLRKEKGFRNESLIVLTGGTGGENKRAALNAIADEPEGIGYQNAEELGPDFFARVATDMHTMISAREAAMSGVSNQLVGDFLESGKQALVELDQARRENDHVGARLAMYRALGNEVKAYEQISTLTGDMLKAIVFYMALMIPFCFFLMKLLFNFSRIEHQLCGFATLFFGVYVIFRFIHPAFAIAMAPEAIFIAFLLSTIGCFVTWLLHQRFEGEMQLLFHTYSGMEPNIGYSTMGQTALLVGVTNMKRRRIRMLLTTATVTLVTFTVLCFSSISTVMSPTIIRKAEHAPYTGFFFHWPGGNPMDEDTAHVFENLFGGRARVVVRRSLQPSESGASTVITWRLEKGARPEAGIEITGIMGLPMADRDFLGHSPLTAGRYFSAADAAEAIISADAAAALGVTPDEIGSLRLRILGEELLLVGIVDDQKYRFVRDLDPNLPLLPTRPDPDAQNNDKITAIPIDVAALLLMPVERARKLGARPTHISVRFADADIARKKVDLWQEISLLLTVTKAKFFVATTAEAAAGTGRKIRRGVYYIGSSYRTSVGGVALLIIPLLIAGTIILNTMLGTVYERRQEIGVYNAIGLTPTHIFLFFLAEALVFGIVGSVGGYLVGQCLAMGIKTLGLIEGFDINFSSLMVVYAILFSIVVVLLSTIYPAIVATRTAVPSRRRKWSMPKADAGRMELLFPFIYQPSVVAGVMFYLDQHFSRFQEKSLCDQVVTREGLGMQQDRQGYSDYRLDYSMALAPFDLGVTQRVAFRTDYDQRLESHRLHLTITRCSGQDTSWVTTNRPFLEGLRQLLLRWRNLDVTQRQWYVEQARQLFARPPAGDDRQSQPEE